MLAQTARTVVNRVMRPPAIALARLGVTPNMVTITGTLGVVAICLTIGVRGHLLLSIIGITLCALTDLLDGAIARETGQVSKWGAFLDSTMDRVADGAIFGALAYWLATEERWSAMAGTIICVVAGSVVPYAKARAESLGFQCDVGFAGRAERLILLGLGALVAAAGFPLGIDIAVWTLTVLAIFTIGQRCYVVMRQDAERRETEIAA